MKFGFLLAVTDINAARHFYEDLFNLTVVDDFGRNIAFDNGLSLQQDFDWLAGIPKSEMKNKENNCELFFEEANFDEFVKRLKEKDNITLLHDVLEHPWGQRAIRFYDLDNHLIEVGESMKSVVENFLASGLSTLEVAKKMDVTKEDVMRMLQS